MTDPPPKDRSPFAEWITDNPGVETGLPEWFTDFEIALGLRHMGPPRSLFVGRCLTEWHSATPGEHCPHGAVRNMRPPAGVAWMEGIGTCDCCGSVYWHNGLRVPENCCTQCGGREITREECRERFPPDPVVPEPAPKTLQERLAEFKARKLT